MRADRHGTVRGAGTVSPHGDAGRRVLAEENMWSADEPLPTFSEQWDVEEDDPGYDRWAEIPPDDPRSEEFDERHLVVVPHDSRGGSRSTWWPRTNPTSLSDLRPPEPPSVLVRSDGQALFYRAAINGLHGESGDGKSWLAKEACRQEMEAGHNVLCVDFEDSYEQWVGDLVALGADWDAIRPYWHYLAPEQPLVSKSGELSRAGEDYREAIRTFEPSLVVIDGVTDAMNLHGLNPDANDDYATFKRISLNPPALAGAAVVTIDHVTKRSDKSGGYAIGAQHKRAGMTGASYEVKSTTPFARGKDGVIQLICRKAKRGHWRKGETVAEAHVTSHGDGTLTIRLNPKLDNAERTQAGEPTRQMERVSRWLEENPGDHSVTEIRKKVTGKAESVNRALDALVASGHATRVTSGQTKFHTHNSPYRSSGT